ncbi:reverse transcriptase [Phytophthora megakarya]|uniref:Reverse transcriptase n=1 Tax=Phytophthora megakarya TaxID=4795 RepID=A0A225VQC8_9STRA|nr:reverse transcriptase [Phytophthora megakarya]
MDLTWDSDQDYDDGVYYHVGRDLDAEDFDVPMSTEDVKIEGIQLCGFDNQTPEKMIDFAKGSGSKRDALPLAARSVVCDIDVGGARPIALKLQIQLREKLVDLTKGLSSAKMISYPRSPCASPIVVIIKKNGVDVML